ncbi:MAG TPA: glutamyl-tRNA reductase, partial [Coxiellaceae bacterium]|nr:glutamyl-tRNA reductase [Coxiellaceae bacterium]
MVLQACGLNYKTAPVELREHFAFDETRSNQLMQTLVAQPAVDGVVLLSTCNRTEVYVDVSQPIDLAGWVESQGNVQLPLVSEHLYTLEGDDLVRHLMRVASGLDSMVLG